MCYFVLVGARAEGYALRELLSADGLLDTERVPDAAGAQRFPLGDTVVCVTLEGCSCALLEPARGGKQAARRERERGAFYAALGRATARFGGVRLLVQSSPVLQPEPRSPDEGTATLGELLRQRAPRTDELLRVVA